MTAARKRWETMQGEAGAVRTATGLRIEVECIDVLPKPSASKARTAEPRATPSATIRESVCLYRRDAACPARSAAVLARQRPAPGFGASPGVRPTCGLSARHGPHGRVS